ncbi:Uncharacterised protein [Dermatophilus congolensis]|uniref:Uncharacterized protein n=1 Tax=Dermatophilus congolensis TaxID=1863 RepID=A0A239VBL0_9MICO|nr:hypothetical protein [Dermatophilus congolensis]SNV19480.1 Uncharacterised protein [Dermatophilus congolensis]
MIAGGESLDLEQVRADDEFLDRLANRECASDEGLEALLGAWTREIDEDADEMAGTPPAWCGERLLPKPRSLRATRVVAVAGAVVVTLSGGMAAVALNVPTQGSAGPLGVVRQAVRSMLPGSGDAVTVPDGSSPVISVPSAGSLSISPMPGRPLLVVPSVGMPGIPGVTMGDPTGSGSVISPAQPGDEGVGPTSVPLVPSRPEDGSASRPGVPSDSGKGKPGPTKEPAPTSSDRPDPKPTSSAPTATPSAPPKDSSSVTTPGGVVPSGTTSSHEQSSVPAPTSAVSEKSSGAASAPVTESGKSSTDGKGTTSVEETR